MEVAGSSPKAEVLNSRELAAFVDDYAPYFMGVTGPVHKALILREPDGSPNDVGSVGLADSTHRNLLEFCQWWMQSQGKSQ